MEQKRSIEDVEFVGKSALVRVDFNVPFGSEGNITDDARIRASLSTINHILDEGGKVILMSHLGRPKGKQVERLSLRPVASRLSRLLRQEVVMAPDCIGEEVRSMVDDLHQAGVMLLENLRFHPGEEANDPEFADAVAMLAQQRIILMGVETDYSKELADQLSGDVLNVLPEGDRALLVNPQSRYELRQGDALFVIAESEPAKL